MTNTKHLLRLYDLCKWRNSLQCESKFCQQYNKQQKIIYHINIYLTNNTSNDVPKVVYREQSNVY